jgi:hypothetical protein
MRWPVNRRAALRILDKVKVVELRRAKETASAGHGVNCQPAKRMLAILLIGWVLPVFAGSAECRADDMSGYCQTVASIVPDIAKARDAGTSESAYLTAQGVNADDDIEKAIVSLVYKSAGLSTDSIRQNILDACTRTDGWAHCKPLTPETGIACIPPE